VHDKLNSAVEVLLEQLEVQLQEVSDTKKTINGLCRRMGKEPMFPDASTEQLGVGPIRPDQYFGRPLSTVAQEFLERRKQACMADEIMKGLTQGGFDFKAIGWQEKDWLRLFSITLAKNSKAFFRLPNGTFGLASWYPEARRDRDERVKQDKVAEPNGSVDTTAATAKNGESEGDEKK
jgi:hypothetical protein